MWLSLLRGGDKRHLSLLNVGKPSGCSSLVRTEALIMHQMLTCLRTATLTPLASPVSFQTHSCFDKYFNNFMCKQRLGCNRSLSSYTLIFFGLACSIKLRFWMCLFYSKCLKVSNINLTCLLLSTVSIL